MSNSRNDDVREEACLDVFGYMAVLLYMVYRVWKAAR